MKLHIRHGTLVCLLALSTFALGQAQSRGKITSTECVSIGTEGLATVGFQVVGTWTGTLQPQAAIQGQPGVNVQVTPTSSTTPQSTVTANGIYTANVAGFSFFQVCGASVGSGTATVYINATQVSSKGSPGGGGSGNVSNSGSPASPQLAQWVDATHVLGTALVNQYYVSTAGNDTTGNGSAATPWATIAKADASLVVAPGGAVVNVAPGTYTKSFTIFTHSGLSNSARVTYVCTVQWQCLIKGDGTNTGHNSVLNLWEVDLDYITIQGFDVSSTQTTNDSFGIHTYGNHIQFLNNRVHDLVATCTASGGAGLAAGGGAADITDIIYRGNWLFNIDTFDTAGGVGNHCHGIYNIASGAVIQNNIIFNNGQGWGGDIQMGLTGTDPIIISHNTAWGNGGQPTAGTHFAGGFILTDTSGNVVHDSSICNNILYNNIGENNVINTVSASGTGNVVCNNILNGNPTNTVGTNVTNPATVSGTITTAPSFQNYQADGTGDYRPTVGANAVAAGATTGATLAISPMIPVNDFSGNVRATGVKPDIGAYTLGVGSTSSSGANTTLSNLGTVAANASISPGVTASVSLGDATHTWLQGFFPSGSTSTPALSIGASNTGIYSSAGSTIDFDLAGSQRMSFSATRWTGIVDGGADLAALSTRFKDLFLSGGVKWTNGSGTLDTYLTRSGAGALQIGTTAANALGSLSAATLSLGTNSTASGIINLLGATSGTATITAPAVAGTATNPIVLSNSVQVPNSSAFVFGTNASLVNFNNTVLVVSGGVNQVALDSVGVRASSVGILGITSGNAGASSDTAFSRDSSGVFDVGNGTAGDKSGSMKLTNLTATGAVTESLGGKFTTTHGSNATAGVSTLSSGTVTVSTTAIAALAAAGAAGDVVNLVLQSCSTCGTLSVGTVTAGTSFVINSTNALDASNVYWEIKHVN